MLDFKEITLGDKPLFDTALKASDPRISEHTFTNFFIWRLYYRFRYAVLDGLICVVSLPPDDVPFALLPIGRLNASNVAGAVKSLGEYFAVNGWELQFRRVDEESLGYFLPFVSGESDILPDRDNSDYVYASTDLIRLAGKKYDGKRNHIHRFKREHTYEYVPFAPEYAGECRRISEEWCAARNCADHKELHCEKLAIAELLNHHETLNCRGALIKVDGRFEAFTMGEMLNGDTAVIHIEKAKDTINGLYTLINQQFVENEWSHVLHVNREQDLGREGMRKAKLSYHPERLINKYTLRIAAR